MTKEKKKPARNALHSNAGGEMTIDDLATIVMDEFGRVREEIQGTRKETRDGFFAVNERLENLENNASEFKKDMTWVKDILEAHTKMLKDLDEAAGGWNARLIPSI